MFTGRPVWSNDEQTIYFFEGNQLFLASDPFFLQEPALEIPGAEILGLVK